MMFLELTLSNNNSKMLVNINRINSIYQTSETTNLYVGEVVYQVSENYEEIVEAINNYGKLPKAGRWN